MALILVVDDDADIRELIQINLESAGFRVVLAANGQEALHAVGVEEPDAIFLDVMMPGVDGWTVLEALKDETGADLAKIPVFMVSAMREVEHRVRGGIEGALRYITKPFNPSELVQALREVLGPDAPPEPELRRKARMDALEELARHESGEQPVGEGSPPPRVRLTRLEHTPTAPAAPPRIRQARERLAELTDKQLLLLEALASGSPVTTVSRHLEMSRSNVYASLRRISRKLGLTGTDELLGILRSGALVESRSGGRH